MKFPYLIETRRILWYEVKCWGYFWGLTEAQVDLLLSDQPVVNYKHDKNKKGGKKEMKSPAAWKVEEAQAKWERKYANGEKPKLNLNLKDFKIE